MAAVCDICAKKPTFGNNRPWSRKITKRRFNPNIQRVRAVINGTPKRMNVCTSCIKAGKVTLGLMLWVTAPADRALLRARYEAYVGAMRSAVAATMPSGAMLMLH